MSPEQQTLPVVRARAGLTEERSEADEARIDEQRAGRGQVHDRLLEREWIDELGADVLELVTATRDVLEDVANTQATPVPPQHVALLSQPADAFAQGHGCGQNVSRRFE